MIAEKVKKIKLITQHFEATVDTGKRTFTIFGDFRADNMYTIPAEGGNSGEPRIMQGLIDELSQLEDEIRGMLAGMEIAGTEAEAYGVFMPYLPEE